MSVPQKKCSKVLLGIGFFLVIVGFALGIAWPYLFGFIAKHELSIWPQSVTFGFWKKTPIPLYLDIYMFSIENAKEFSKDPKGVKPIMKQYGPYVFLEVHERENITWNNANHSISYMQKRTWQFQPDISADLQQNITNLNPIPLTAAYLTRFQSWAVKESVNMGIRLFDNQLTVTHTAAEWTFDGFHDPLLDIVNKLPIHIPVNFPSDKFGLFYGRNGSIPYDGWFNMFTGTDDIYKVGSMNTWNYKKRTNYYRDTCADVRGSSGELFPPYADVPKQTELFIPDICATLSVPYHNETDVNHIRGYQFRATDSLFDNGTKYPETACYCVGECVPSGVRNVSACKFGSPAFVSAPHFLLADPIYRTNVKGMNPDHALHDLFLTVEPTSGIPLQVRATLQINLYLQQFKDISLYKNTPKVMVPLLWFAQRTQITPKLASYAFLVMDIHTAGFAVFYTLAIIGLLMLIGATCSLVYNKNREDLQTLIVPQSEVES